MKKVSKLIGKLMFLPLLAVMSFGCKQPIPINEAPETKIERQYKDDGYVEYKFLGTDSDGFIDYISANINGSSQNVSNNSSVLVQIIEGNNIVTATAYDNEGEFDPTPATDSFYSPTDLEASDLIEQTLDPNTYTNYAKNYEFTSPPCTVNALIQRKSDGKDVIIDYMGTHKEDLDEFWPNICPQRTSVEELERKVLEFQNNGYEE